MKKQLITIDLNEFPKELHQYLENSKIYDSSCHSSAKVYYIDTGYYLKVDEVGKLQNEAMLTSKFFTDGLGVEVISYISSDKDYMLTRSAVGIDLTHYLDDPKELCHVLASTLRNLHTKSIDGYPYSSHVEAFTTRYQNQSLTNSFDQWVVMKCFEIHSFEEAVSIIKNNKDKLQHDTLIHGDYCLPNIIINNGAFSSLIDLGMSGIGDKHIDLYWAIWSLEFNLKTDEYTDYFLDLYGRDNFDYDMLRVVAAFESIA